MRAGIASVQLSLVGDRLVLPSPVNRADLIPSLPHGLAGPVTLRQARAIACAAHGAHGSRRHPRIGRR